MTIVVYRPKRPPKKQKASVLARAAKAATKVPVIVKPTDEKRLRAERVQQADGEPNPGVDAFFARNVRPGGPLPPHR